MHAAEASFVSKKGATDVKLILILHNRDAAESHLQMERCVNELVVSRQVHTDSERGVLLCTQLMLLNIHLMLQSKSEVCGQYEETQLASSTEISLRATRFRFHIIL